ncbi:MAG: heavy metal-associated domain-containing protein [Myxococcota bacterium]
MQHLTTRRVARDTFFVASAVSLGGAGLTGFLFEKSPMDMVLLQLVFYGAWACLVGARVGGWLGAAMEEDCCSDLDMGVTSSMGSILGTLSAGLVGTALTGLALQVPWLPLWVGAVGLTALHALVGWWRPLVMIRLPHLDERGRVCGPNGLPLAGEQQPLRMRDRLAILLTVSVVLLLVLTFVMAALMGGQNLGHPVMMAPMMYGMFGTMLGGLLGGWLAGLLDEHRGHPDHDNPVMVAAMALMAGMMGGMPSGMIGGMMAVMGMNAVVITVVAGGMLVLVSWALVVRGRYRLAVGGSEEAVRPPLPETRTHLASNTDPVAAVAGGALLRVRGMTCDACVGKVTRHVGAMPGVTRVRVELREGLVELSWGEGFGVLADVEERIERLGYEVGR